MLVGAIHACERYYPAFQFVVWAGKTASEAMSAAMFDTEGEAVARHFLTFRSPGEAGTLRRSSGFGKCLWPFRFTRNGGGYGSRPSRDDERFLQWLSTAAQPLRKSKTPSCSPAPARWAARC